VAAAADTISWGFVPGARARGLDASAMVVSGCEMIRGPVVSEDGSVVPWSPRSYARPPIGSLHRIGTAGAIWGTYAGSDWIAPKLLDLLGVPT
jgi:hypothetical protein